MYCHVLHFEVLHSSPSTHETHTSLCTPHTLANAARQVRLLHVDRPPSSSSPRGSRNLIKTHEEKSPRPCHAPPAVPANKCSMAAIIFTRDVHSRLASLSPLFTLKSRLFYAHISPFLSYFTRLHRVSFRVCSYPPHTCTVIHGQALFLLAF